MQAKRGHSRKSVAEKYEFGGLEEQKCEDLPVSLTEVTCGFSGSAFWSWGRDKVVSGGREVRTGRFVYCTRHGDRREGN